MGSEWKELPLEEAMDAIIDYRGKTPKKTDSGIPLMGETSIRCGYYDNTQTNKLYF
jgi:type I restriction enzyme S subunit